MMVECDNMKNSKGQALVEFIIVLPILLLVLISIIDFGNIATKKYSLQNDMDVVANMYKDNSDKIDNYAYKNNFTVAYKSSNDFVTITLKKKVKVLSPMVNLVLGKNYTIDVSKTIYTGYDE